MENTSSIIQSALDNYNRTKENKIDTKTVVDKALSTREKNAAVNLENVFYELQNNISKEFEYYNTLKVPSDTSKINKAIDEANKRTSNIFKIKNKAELYRKQLGDEITENFSQNIDILANAYKEYIYQLQDSINYPSEDIKVIQKEVDDLNAKLKLADNIKKAMSNAAPVRNNEIVSQKLDELLKEYGYKSYDDLKKAADERNSYLNRAKNIQGNIKLTNDALNDVDFGAYSQKGEETWKNKTWLTTSDNMVAYWRNNPKEMESYEKLVDGNGAIGKSIIKNDDASGKFLLAKHGTNEEYKIYNFYLAKDKENGTNNADEYIKSIRDELNLREGQSVEEKYKDKSALSKIMFGYEAGLDQFVSGVSNAFNFTDDYIPTTATQYASQGIRKQLYNTGFDLPNWLGGTSLGQVTYDAVKTTANMLPSIAVGQAANVFVPGAGTYVTAGLMGLSATGNAYQQMLNQGYNKTTSRTYASLVGLSEASLSAALSGMIGGKATEKAVENVIKGIDKGFFRFAVRWGMSGASEIPEEALQTLLEPMLQNIALGYEKNKLEDIDWSQVAYDGLLGGISGLGLGGVTSAISTGVEQHNWNTAGKNVRANDTFQNVFDVAQLTPQESDAYATYTRYANQGINAENVTNTQLGRLYNESNTYAQEVLNSKKSTVNEKENATKVLSELSKADEKSTVDKETIANVERSVAYEGALHENVDALIESGLESAENTKSHKLAVELKNKVDSGQEITTKEIVKLQEANEVAIAQEIKTMALENGIAEDDVQLFESVYDGAEDVSEFATDFNRVRALSMKGVSQDRILQEAKALTPSQVSQVYFATRKSISDTNKKIAQEKQSKLDAIAKKYSGKVAVKGKINDSIIDYTNSTKDGSKVNWHSLSYTEQNEIMLVKAIAQVMGANLNLNKSKLVNGEYKGANGQYDGDTNTITMDVYAGRTSANALSGEILKKGNIISSFSHETTHWGKDKAPELYNSLRENALNFLEKATGKDRETLISEEIARIKKAHPELKNVDEEYAVDELIARTCEDMLSNSKVAREMLSKLTPQEQKTFIEKIKELITNFIKWIDDVLGVYPSNSKEAKLLRENKAEFENMLEIWDGMLAKAVETNQALQHEGKKVEKNTTSEGDVKYSLVGRTVDGIGIYKTNYSKGTPKSVKQNDLISLVQNIWSNNPITLKIVENGTIKEIKAKFNPELSERSDLSKIVFGNRKGTGSEKRMTLDLSSDLYQIAADSRYLYSKDATPKPNNPAHDGVTKYHYFITNLVYKDNENNYTPCYMNIDVKQNSDGNWFYSFAIEKGSVPQTLLAAVTENSATLPISSIQQTSQKSQEKMSDRDSVSVYDKMGESEKLIKENAQLKKRLKMSNDFDRSAFESGRGPQYLELKEATSEDEVAFSMPIDTKERHVKKYSEEQYNNFGWVYEGTYPANTILFDDVNSKQRYGEKSYSNASVKYAVRDDFTDAEYNKLISKKPIKVSKQEWARINSRRTQKYANISEEDIPVLDIIKLAEYNKINEAYNYFIRNNDKYAFDIIAKKKIKPNFERFYKEEIADYEKTHSQNDRNENRERLDRSGDESTRNREAVRKDESSIGQSSKSDIDYDFRQGNFDSRRGIKRSDRDSVSVYDKMEETNKLIKENEMLKKRLKVSNDFDRSAFESGRGPKYLELKEATSEDEVAFSMPIEKQENTKNKTTSVENFVYKRYNNFDTYFGENLYDTPQNLKPSTDQEWHTFCRSFANKTANISQGDFKIITIFTADNYYIITADGYMSGTVLLKNSIAEYNEKEQIFDDDTRTNIFVVHDEGTRNRERNRDYDSDTFAGGIPDTFDVELDEFVAKHPEWFANRRESYADYKRRLKATSEDEVAFSMPIDTKEKYVEKYSEEQYNDFGWVRNNNILSAAEYSTLLSRYADYKHNKDNYPTTKFGEAVVFSFDYLDVLMYVKGTIRNPQITKVVRITEDNIELLKSIREEILKNEYQQVPLPYRNVQIVFGEGILDISRKRDFISFQGYKRERERKLSKENSFLNKDQQNGKGSSRENTGISGADSIEESAFSMPIGERRKKQNHIIEFSKEYTDELMESFGIINLGDYIHVQKRVMETLESEGFFADKENRCTKVVNDASGMVVEINKKGIKETFDFYNYICWSYEKKIAKLAAIRKLPEIIKYGELIKDNVENVHEGSAINKSFAYIRHKVTVDGKKFVVQIDIKKSPQKNKFWVHKIIKNIDVNDFPASNKTNAVAGQKTIDINNIGTNDIPNNVKAVELGYTGVSANKESVSQEIKNVNNDYTTNTDIFDGVEELDLQEIKYIEKICENLGVKVVFDDLRDIVYKGKIISPDGYISNGVIHLNTYAHNPIGFVFKHELTHYTEKSKKYKEFANAVKNSSLYQKWICEKTGEENVRIAEYKYKQKVFESNVDIESISSHKTEAEMIADFVGEMLFTDNGSGIVAITAALEHKQRNVFVRFIIDFINKIKKFFSNESYLLRELSILENGFTQLLVDATKSNEDSDGPIENDVQFCFVRCTDETKILDADKMVNDGFGNDDIYKNTGMFKNVFGEWVVALDVEKFVFYPYGNSGTSYNLIKKPTYIEGRLRDVVYWPELYELFPEFEKVRMIIKDSNNPYDTVRFIPSDNGGMICINKKLCDDYYYKNRFTAKADMLKAIQKMIQLKEGNYIGRSFEYWGNLEKDGKLPYSNVLERYLTAQDMMEFFIDNYDANMAANRYREIYRSNRNRPRNKVEYNPKIKSNLVITYDKNKFVALSEKDSKNPNILLNEVAVKEENNLNTADRVRELVLSRKIANLEENVSNSEIITGGSSGFAESFGHKYYTGYMRLNEQKQKGNFKIASTDTNGRKLSDSLQENLNGNILTSKNDEVLSFYAMVPKNRSIFTDAKIGLHVGTIDLIKEKYAGIDSNEFELFEFYPNVKNPLYLKSDPEEMTISEVCSLLHDMGIIEKGEYNYLIERKSTQKAFKYNNFTVKKIRENIKDAGYDCIAFENKDFDVGGLSFIIFDDSQLIPVAKDGILIEGNGITESGFDKVNLETKVRNAKENSELLAKYIMESKFGKYKKKKPADNKIKLGGCDYLEDKSISKDEILDNLAKNLSCEISGCDTANREFNKRAEKQLKKCIFKNDKGEIFTFCLWNTKPKNISVAIRNGVEFGTVNSAFEKFFDHKLKNFSSYNGVFEEFILNCLNPIILELNEWNALEVAKYLLEQKLISKKYFYELKSMKDIESDTYVSYASQALREKIKTMGYDCLMFIKDDRSKTVVPFYDDQIIPISKNGIINEYCILFEKNSDLIEGSVININSRTGRNFKAIKNQLVLIEENTEKLKYLTNELSNSDGYKLKSFNVGYSGDFEQGENTIWRPKLVVEKLLSNMSPLAENKLDIAGRPINDTAYDILKDTFLKSDDGRPLSFFLWNIYGNNRFMHNSLGYRLSTLTQAFYDSLQERSKNGQFEEYYVKSKKPYIMKSIPKEFITKEFVDDFYLSGLLSDNEYQRIIDMNGIDTRKNHTFAAKTLIRKMKSQGYDSIVYMNESGNIGIIPFSAKQLVPVSINGEKIEFNGLDAAGSKESAFYIREIENNVEKTDDITLDGIGDEKYNENVVGLTLKEKQVLKEKTGWSDTLINFIRSMEEAQHYIDIGLIEKEINGRICLIRSDIDLDYVDSKGITNRDRIRVGTSPKTRNGEEIHLHHIGQKQNSPLAELTRTEHLGKGNYSILHDTKKTSEIDRIEFSPERRKHWETRFNIGG